MLAEPAHWRSGLGTPLFERKGWGSNPGRCFFFFFFSLKFSKFNSRGQRSLPVQEASQVGNRYRRSSNVVFYSHYFSLCFSNQAQLIMCLDHSSLDHILDHNSKFLDHTSNPWMVGKYVRQLCGSVCVCVCRRGAMPPLTINYVGQLVWARYMSAGFHLRECRGSSPPPPPPPPPQTT